jgi:hypothetical protein
VNLSRLNIGNRAFSFNAVDRFQVVLVMHFGAGTGVNDRIMQGKPHTVFSQQQSPAAPSLSGYVSIGILQAV